ncbi:MAG: LysM peptidoglycan-binding domain-containing protein [Hyphomicrobium sp.]|nr:LysM peptidoglycan-binding domain-containing protein [Hyphomicrobium sp.]
MKTGQAAKNTRYLPMWQTRWLHRWVAAGMAIAVLGMAFPQRLLAAIDPHEGAPNVPALKLWTVAQATTPPGDAVVPPVRREQPAATPAEAVTPPAAAAPVKKQEPTPQISDKSAQETASPETGGILGTIQDWLAQANREYQGVIVKELSLPPADAPSQDAIADKLKEQQAEDARKAADAKRAADDASKAAAAAAAAKAKAAEAQKLAEDRQKAEETKRMADEAKKAADELLKAGSETKPAQPAKTEAAKTEAAKPEPAKPDVAAPAVAPAQTPGDAAKLAEQQRLEAQKLAEETKRQEQLRLQEQQRKAAEAKRADDERKKAEAARIADERRKAAEARAAEAKATAAKTAPEPKSTSRTIVLTPEPLPAPVVRPVDPGTTFRPELSPSRATRVAANRSDLTDEPAPQRRRIRIYHEPTYRGITAASYRPVRGTAVKRWVWRAPNGQSCRAAGRQVTPPARYTIRRGDSLWRISERHYHQGRLYPKIYSANRAAIADPDLIYPCQRVLVPR